MPLPLLLGAAGLAAVYFATKPKPVASTGIIAATNSAGVASTGNSSPIPVNQGQAIADLDPVIEVAADEAFKPPDVGTAIVPQIDTSGASSSSASVQGTAGGGTNGLLPPIISSAINPNTLPPNLANPGVAYHPTPVIAVAKPVVTKSTGGVKESQR